MARLLPFGPVFQAEYRRHARGTISRVVDGGRTAFRAYAPVAMDEAKHQLGDRITYCVSDMEALQGTDALVFITEWAEFRVPNWEKVGAELSDKVICDGRNLYRREVLVKAGFDYFCIGQSEKMVDELNAHNAWLEY